MPSEGEGDVTMSGVFTENVTGNTISPTSALTVVRIELTARVEAPENKLTHRHKFGIGEFMDFSQESRAPAAEFVLLRCYECPPENGKRCVGWGFRPEAQSFKVRVAGVQYDPLVSVVCPSGIKTQNAHWETNGLLPGVAGGIRVVQEYLVEPLDVSFRYLAVEEVPCDEVIEPTGYFAFYVTDRNRTHTRAAGAGVWWDVDGNNRVGGADWMVDDAGFKSAVPRMKPDGTTTTNTAYGWLGGTLEWKIPFGWQETHPGSFVPPIERFATDTRQIFTITPTGDCTIRKFSAEAQRMIDGQIHFTNGGSGQ